MTERDGGADVTAKVEVWCASLDRWVPGFDLVALDAEDGCIVRRRSDGEVLPIAFSTDQVRSPADPRPLGGPTPRRRRR